ncbi:hypothetical protein NQ317_001087 [Molorchus minor]|uniref:DNA-directed DNA polymerase n=1 Tax=Molorchus minor TaxID=1323400 RepID=A0ABQ9JN63_9CUCU|nr:hypothetical protein NQ317_001087 [Molorchus minor]
MSTSSDYVAFGVFSRNWILTTPTHKSKIASQYGILIVKIWGTTQICIKSCRFAVMRRIHGGISQCSGRKHIANNQFLPNYNPDEPTSFITYLDATNLYGHSMSQAFPTGGFIWLPQEEIVSISDNNNEGCIFEVDIHYSQDSHADLLFLVETIIPPNSQSKLPKLIPNLNDKKIYVVHYRTL